MGQNILTLVGNVYPVPTTMAPHDLNRSPSLLWPAVVLGLLAAFSPARSAGQSKSPTFERDVLPLFTTHCLKCHGAKERKAGLDLRTLPGIAEGSDSGPILVPGSPDRSLLFKQVATGKMPPGKTKLAPAQVRMLRAWILTGARAAQPLR